MNNDEQITMKEKIDLTAEFIASFDATESLEERPKMIHLFAIAAWELLVNHPDDEKTNLSTYLIEQLDSHALTVLDGYMAMRTEVANRFYPDPTYIAFRECVDPTRKAIAELANQLRIKHTNLEDE